MSHIGKFQKEKSFLVDFIVSYSGFISKIEVIPKTKKTNYGTGLDIRSENKYYKALNFIDAGM